MGEPDSPRVVMESRRCGMACALLAVGWLDVVVDGLEKRSEKGRPAREPRRGRVSDEGTEMGEVERSSDMVEWFAYTTDEEWV